MRKFLLVLIIVAVSTSSLTAELASSCEKFNSLQVCKDSSGAVSSVHTSDDSADLRMDPAVLGISSIGPAAFENPNIIRLTIFSGRSEYNMNENVHKWLCIPSIIKVTSESFHGLPSVEIVRVECVELRGPQNIFNHLSSLKVLSLLSNKFTEFPQQLCADIPTLEVLEVSGQQIKTLSPPSFAGISGKLEELILYSNELKSIEPRTFARFQHLKILNLSNNRLEILGPELFDGLDTLVDINLSKNWLREIQAETFSQIGNLRTLNLAKNRLEILPRGIFINLRNLEYLSLEGNKISSVSRHLVRRLHNLRYLSLGFHENVEIERNAFYGMKLDDFWLNADDLTYLDADTFNGLSTFNFHLHRNKTINFEPNLFRGFATYIKIIIYETKMSKWTMIDRPLWGLTKDVPIDSERGSDGRSLYT